MSKTKLFTTLQLAIVVLFAQVGTVAASQAQDITSITGTIQSLTTDTDVAGNTIVLVTLEDALGRHPNPPILFGRCNRTWAGNGEPRHQ